MSLYEDLRVIALRAVKVQDGSYNLRYIFRWYSRTFSTPLDVVEDLPLDDVLTAFYETRYEEMEDEALDLEIKMALETEEARLERLRRADAADSETADFMAFTQQQIQAKQATKAEDPKIPALKAELRQALRGPDRLPGAPSTLPTPQEAPPEIHMKFVSDEEMEKLLEGDMGAVPDDGKKTP